MLIDALVLAGGRSSRLDSVPKSELVFLGQSLLERALSAVSGARTVVVIGPQPPMPLPANAIVARENPPFGGPAAAIAAGVDALLASGHSPSQYAIVLACDMPGIGPAVRTLIHALGNIDSAVGADGVIAIDDRHHLQPLAAIYDTVRLGVAIAQHRRVGSLDGMSAFQLIRELRLTEVMIPAHTTDDIDTWADAEKFGITHPEATTKEEK